MPAAERTTAIVKTNGFKKRRSGRLMPSPSGADLRRYFLVEQQGMSVDEVCRVERTNVLNVQASVDYVKEWKLRNSTAMLETKAIEVAMAQMDSAGLVLQRGMKAEKVVFVNQETGKIKKVPDIAMQLQTVDRVLRTIEITQPKSPLVQNNQQNVFGTPGGGFGSAVSFESILRRKREQKGLVNSQEAEIIQAEMTHAESVDAEFKDLGGADDEDEGEDEDDDAE